MTDNISRIQVCDSAALGVPITRVIYARGRHDSIETWWVDYDWFTGAVIGNSVVGDHVADAVPVGSAATAPPPGGPQIEVQSGWVIDAGGAWHFFERAYDEDAGTWAATTYSDSPGGATTSPALPVSPAADASDRELLTAPYRAIAAGSGYAIGDELDEVRLLDLSSATPQTPLQTWWVNKTQGTTLASVLAADVLLADGSAPATVRLFMVRLDGSKTGQSTARALGAGIAAADVGSSYTLGGAGADFPVFRSLAMQWLGDTELDAELLLNDLVYKAGRGGGSAGYPHAGLPKFGGTDGATYSDPLTLTVGAGGFVELIFEALA